ncbi:porin [Microvirga pudoricolor]|uniref:porin n=1 Tax=Microvirga pudoricolor TaxID=2778729 RepID=UPI00194F7460|nr:porin [Microvirga pudoricolor]MBM6595251.1 porin [Microvirga pudoricolor]
MTGGAQASDLPAKAASPIEYVRICSTHGAGFFYVPGTETCLRVGGRVRAEYLYLQPVTRLQDTIGFRARGRINVDARTATAYGILRAYIRMEITRSSGAYTGGGIDTSPEISQAFIQFDGLTAGRAVSFFTSPDLPAPNFGDLRFDDPSNAEVTLLAYTYSFGNGLSATLSLEDGIERRVNNELSFPLFGAGVTGPVFAPIASTYAGERMPDVVGNLRYTGTWGEVQLAAALHQIRDVAVGVTAVGGVTLPVFNPVTGLPNPTFAGTEYGFALGAHGYMNVPALGEGDTLWISTAYANGAIGYLNAGQAGPISNGFISAGPLTMPFTDAFVEPFTGEFKTNKAYAIAGGLNHNWTPTVQTNLFGSWMRFDAPRGAQYVVPATTATLANGSAGSTTGIVDFNEYRVGANVIWMPVKEFQIGVEALYIRVDPRQRVAVPLTTAAGDPTGAFRSTGSEDTWEGRLRVQRDF